MKSMYVELKYGQTYLKYLKRNLSYNFRKVSDIKAKALKEAHLKTILGDYSDEII